MPEVIQRKHGDAEAEHRHISNLLTRAAEEKESFVHVWRPNPQVAFGRQDQLSHRISIAREEAKNHGLEPVVRNAGGHAVAHTGGTIGFGVAVPINDMLDGLHERYRIVSRAIQNVTDEFVDGVVTCREPGASFCPGDYSLSVKDSKVAGIAQRIQKESALISGTVIVTDLCSVTEALIDVYAALGLEFEPSSVGSLQQHGCSAGFETLMHRIESELYNGLHE